jgi:LEA14-like dessication related protein
VALVALAAAGAGCASLGMGAEPIDVNVVNLAPLPSTAFEHRLRVDLRLRNPNDRSYEIDGLRFALEVNGRRLATGVWSEAATLPRLGEVVIPVTTTTTLLDLVNQILAFGQTEQPRFEYTLRGRLFLANSWGGIDFEREGSHEDLAGGDAH